MFDFSNYSVKSGCCDESKNYLLVRSYKTKSVANEEFLRLDPEMFLLFLNNYREHLKKQRVLTKILLQK